MPTREERHRFAHLAVRKYDLFLMRDPNVTAVGLGEKLTSAGIEPCVKIFVKKKVAAGHLSLSALLPAFLPIGTHLVPTDIVELGPCYPLDNNVYMRPARPGAGISAAESPFGFGTFGAVVIDDSSGKNRGQELILSNNHVLAEMNSNPPGTRIIQPGAQDSSKCGIATLLRYVPLKVAPEVSLADAAVALPIQSDMVSNNPLDQVPQPSPECRAIGLLWAGGDGVSWLNPIQTVLTLLEVSFPLAGSVADARINMSVQKTGAASGRTTGNVISVHTTVSIPYDTFGIVTLCDQIGVACLAEPGDSGSLAVENNQASEATPAG